MAWGIRWSDDALRALKRIDKYQQQCIVSYIQERIATGNNPRQFGKALTGNLTGQWSYRVGDYRVICRIEDELIRVSVVMVGHRRHIYQ